ncbi:hypothetical protein YC2023_072456 [Brassica napus]
MDLQGWDPGDQWLLRGNWKVLRYNQKADLHPYDVFFGGWKLKGVDSRTNLWSLGKFHPIRRGESKGSSISFRLREFPSRILQSRDLALIKARSQVLSGSRFKGRRMDIIGSALQGKWRHMRRSWLFRISRRWDSGAGGTVWWGLVDWQRVYQGNEKELLLFLQENKRELLLFCFLAHRVSLFTVTLQVYLGNLGMLGLYGGIFWNSWERWIRDRYNNTTTACFFLNIILVWSVKINRSVRVLEMVVEDIIFLVSKWYEQMIDLFGFSYLEVNSREKHYTYTKMRLGVGDEITAQPLVTKQKNRSYFYEYSPSKSSESSEMLEVVWTTEVKSSGLPGSHLDFMEIFSRSLPFIIDLSVLSSQVTDFKVNCKNNLCVDQTTSSSLWRESERYVVFSSQEWKKKKGKSILGALRASNWLFMVVVVLMIWQSCNYLKMMRVRDIQVRKSSYVGVTRVPDEQNASLHLIRWALTVKRDWADIFFCGPAACNRKP